MAKKKPTDERLRTFVAATLADRPLVDRESIHGTERGMETLADAVADEFAARLLARPTKREPDVSHCPDCGGRGQLFGQRQREILTTRGSAPFIEPKPYCPACRRHSFASVRGAGQEAQREEV